MSSTPTEVRIEKFLLGFALIYLAANVSHWAYSSSFDSINLTTVQSYAEYTIRVVCDITLSWAILLMIIGGIRNIRTHGYLLKRIVMPLTGCLLCLLFGYFSAWGHWQMSSTLETEQRFAKMEKQNIIVLEKSYSELIQSPKLNLKSINLIVHMRYDIDGKKLKYVNESGQLVPYEPSPQVIESKRNAAHYKKLGKNSIESLKNAAYVWLVLMLSGLVLGIFTPVKKQEVH